MRLDDAWFIANRGRLLHSCVHPDGKRGHSHLVHNILESSRLSDDDGARRARVHTEQAIARLAPRHRGAVRAHMQLYRAALEIIGFLPSDGIVNSAVQIEWLWYTTPFQRVYRDHLAHVMKVALTGLHLLESPESPFADGSELLIDQVACRLASGEWGSKTLRTAARRCGNETLDENFWRAAVLEATRIAGLLHDMAYADVMAVNVERAARPVRPRAPFESSIDETCRHAIELLQHHLVASPFHRGKLPGPEGIDKQDREIAAEVLLKGGHSLRAGYALLRILEESKRVGSMTPFDVFVMEWAALAASMHDYDKFYGDKVEKAMQLWLDKGNRRWVQPDFEQDPVSFIVALADQLQDFGRMSYENYDQPAPKHNFASTQVRYPFSAVEIKRTKTNGVFDLELEFVLGHEMSDRCFDSTADPGKIAKIARKKLHEPAFSWTENLGSASSGKLDPWLRAGSLYKDVRIRVVHDGKDHC